jgi:hypothetical protein
MIYIGVSAEIKIEKFLNIIYIYESPLSIHKKILNEMFYIMNKTSVFVLKNYLDYELNWNLRNKTKGGNTSLEWLNYANKNNPTLF